MGCFKRSLQVAFIGMIIVWGQIAWSQEKDSLKTNNVAATKWLSKPSSGRTDKTVGVLAMIYGGISSISGLIRLSQSDPCEEVRSPGTICTSNIDEVHTIGAIQLGVGVGAFVFGVVRYNAGVRKAKAYEEWKRKNEFSSGARGSYSVIGAGKRPRRNGE